MAGFKLNVKANELKKHVGMIHSTNSLSLLERKIANVLLYNAYNYLLDKVEHEILISELCNLIGFNSNDIKRVKTALKSLMSTVLEWNLLGSEAGGKGDVWMASTMLSDVKIEGRLCTYSYSNRMKELCHYPDVYAKISLEHMKKFKSSYGLALYENCVRYQSIKQTPWIDITMFRKLMGVSESQYLNINDLKKRVIRKAIEEVNKYTKISIIDEYKKKNREVISIRFLIFIKDTLEHVDEDSLKNKIENVLLKDYGFNRNVIKKLLESYGEDYIDGKIKIIESSQSYKKGKIDNISRYLKKALEEDYKAPVSSADVARKKVVAKEASKLENEAKIKLKQKYIGYQNEALKGLFDSLAKKEKKMILDSFSDHISSTLYYDTYLKEGIKNPLVWERFAAFIRSSKSDLLKELTSFEAFCSGEICEPS